MTFAGHPVTVAHLPTTATVRRDLAVALAPNGRRLDGLATYRPDALPRRAARALLADYQALLARAVQHPHTRLWHPPPYQRGLGVRAIVLAGGHGSRLAPLTPTVPKPLVPVLNRPVLSHVLRRLAAAGITNVGIAITPHTTLLRDYYRDGGPWGVALTWLAEPVPLGTGGALRAHHAFFDDQPALVVTADMLTGVDLTALVAQHHAAPATVTVAASVQAPASWPGDVLLTDGIHARAYLFKPGPIAPSSLGSCGTCVVDPAILDTLPQAALSTSPARSCPPCPASGSPCTPSTPAPPTSPTSANSTASATPTSPPSAAPSTCRYLASNWQPASGASQAPESPPTPTCKHHSRSAATFASTLAPSSTGRPSSATTPPSADAPQSWHRSCSLARPCPPPAWSHTPSTDNPTRRSRRPSTNAQQTSRQAVLAGSLPLLPVDLVAPPAQRFHRAGRASGRTS